MRIPPKINKAGFLYSEMEEVHTIPLSEIYQKFDSSPQGLSSEEVQTRLQAYGKNEIKKKKGFEPFKIFFSQFKSFLIYILIIASAISFAIGHMVDGFVIATIVMINACIGFFQQYKAERAIRNLKKLIVIKARVVRDGKQMEIASTELVPGDIVLLEAGDKISADIRILESENAATIEAVLTGESLPISKQAGDLGGQVSLSQRNNMLFAGTSLARGTAMGMVVNTGMKTVFGEIAENLQEITPTLTPMQRRLNTFSKQIGFFILGLVAIIAFLGFTDKFDLIEMFLTAVALAVSAIPSGLPAVLAMAFALGSIFMSKKNVIIRRLPAVESLGSVTVICTDKTGTLTEEKMTVQSVFANNTFYGKRGHFLFDNEKKIDITKSKELSLLVKTSVLCNNARYEKNGEYFEYIGDPTETALVENAVNLGFDKKALAEAEPSTKKFEFDSVRKMMSVVRNSGKYETMYSKGAIKKILIASDRELIDGKVVPLSHERKIELLRAASVMESKALRVLGFAVKNLKLREEASEDKLIFLGMVGMIDPPREEVELAIKECRDAGIKVKIITGDSELTAKAIGEQIGIKGRVVNEVELAKMSDEELLLSMREISIFARTDPQQKLRIVNALQKLGETVAVTGDGVNDVLALKSADVGISMGKRGSDISRDVSDLILMDDNFASIVEGVKEGRRTYDNIKKFTKYLLAVNFSEIFLVMITLLMGLPLPLIPLQILWLNLISDSFPSLTLAFEKEDNVMKGQPRSEKSILSGIWGFLILAGLIAFVAEFSVFLIGLGKNLPIEEVRTLVLTTAVSFELLFVYACRSSKALHKIGIFSNKWLNIAVLGSLLVHLLLVYTKLGNFFGMVPLTLNDWLFVIPFALSGVVIFELYKIFAKRKSVVRRAP